MYRVNNIIGCTIFLLTIFVSLISQMPSLLDSGASNLLKLIWALPFLYLLLVAPQTYLSGKLFPFYLFVFTIESYCLICQLLTGNTYFGPDNFNFAISLLVTAISYSFWMHYGGNKILQIICGIMLLGGLMIAIQLYFNYLSQSDITNKTYAYGDKNSAGQILLSCAYLTFLFFNPQNKVFYWGSRGIAVILIIIMIMLRSRATLVSAAIMLGYYILTSNNKKLKWGLIILLVLGCGYIAINSNASEIIVQGILMGGRDASDVDSLSSGRILMFSIALQLIPQHPWVGCGKYYVDCLPLNILTEFGIIGLTILLGFLTLLFITLRKEQNSSKIHQGAYVMYLSFLANALFEAQPPFGPGMKCFALWMLVGFALSCHDRKSTKLPLNHV